MRVDVGEAKGLAAGGDVGGIDQVDHVARTPPGAGGAACAAFAASQGKAQGSKALRGVAGDPAQCCC